MEKNAARPSSATPSRQASVPQKTGAPAKTNAPMKPGVKTPAAPGKKKSGAASFILTFLLVLVIGGAGISYYFNLFGVKDKVVGFFITQDAQYQQALAAAQARESEAAAKEQELLKKEEDLNAREETVTRKEASLAKKQDDFKAAQDSLSERESSLASSSADLDNLVETVRSMDAKSAADMLLQFYSTTQVTRILSRMEPNAVAKILEEMEPGQSAAIMQQLISNAG